MKEDRSGSTACKVAAARVHGWLGRGRTHLLSIPLLTKEQHFSKMHHCGLLKLPRISSQAHWLPFEKFRLVCKQGKTTPQERVIIQEDDSKSLPITVASLPYSLNQKYPYSLLYTSLLSADKVVQWRLKEHLFACKKLKALAQQTHIGPKYHDVIPILSSDLLIKDQRVPYREEWGKFHEERHFQIDRVSLPKVLHHLVIERD